MERFLVNMAVVKVNFTREAANIIDTYLPLDVSYALSRMQPEHFSIDTFREEFNKFAEFNIPTGAMIALLKRAEKRKKYISKNTDGTYSINHDNLSVIDYEAIRDDQQLRYEKLAERFQVFCEEKLSRKIEHSDIESYFFEILYELSPQLFPSMPTRKN